MSLARKMLGPCAVEDLEHVRKHLTRGPGDPMFAFSMRVLQAALGGAAYLAGTSRSAGRG